MLLSPNFWRQQGAYFRIWATILGISVNDTTVNATEALIHVGSGEEPQAEAVHEGSGEEAHAEGSGETWPTKLTGFETFGDDLLRIRRF